MNEDILCYSLFVSMHMLVILVPCILHFKMLVFSITF